MTGYEPLNTLKPVAADLWVVDGPAIRFYGLPFPTRMTVVRLPDGGLWLHSPIAPDPGLLAALAALGPVRHLIAPNWIHYAHLPAWQALMPEAVTWAAPGVAARATSRNLALRIDRVLPHTGPEWGEAIDHLLIAGSDLHREIAFCHRPSRSLILTDLIENFERRAVAPWMVPLLMVAGNLDPDGKAPIDMRMSFRKGRAALRRSVQRMQAWNPERIVLAHGRWYPENGAGELARAFRWALD
ncbi:MAG TPA: DUF4336 domain-containing protein [Pararhodobacter sp.]|uniref:DUF4336 domain-containing protein n=1 Tax=Pararhodobacter sp. TaxID=2127056 RepID=UPI002CFCDAF6|nr:DUF4336 domain-containing protein [Pararhodobacter sp.]HPD92814.1 DUF4336 domain-containing protein [Pararhodobacter sp.]